MLVERRARDVERPDEIEVVSIDPNSIPVRVDREATRSLPVVPRIVGEPAGGAVAGEIQALPESAVVRGPQSLLASLDALTTSPVSLDGHAFSFEQTVVAGPARSARPRRAAGRGHRAGADAAARRAAADRTGDGAPGRGGAP